MRESIARPLAVRVDGQPDAVVVIPDGVPRDLGAALGQVWVLEGVVELAVATQGPAPWQGSLDLQLCTASVCSPPAKLRWTTDG